MARGAALLLLLTTTAASCVSSGSAGDDGESAGEATTGGETDMPTVERPDGPAADLSVELTGGNGAFVATPEPVEPDLEAGDYVQHEYAASGTAASYTATDALGEDGRWDFEPADTADYTTRVLVRRPADVEDFSGTVVVEWLNVSAGFDTDAEWRSLYAEVIRQGHAWVGVSAQLIGVNGGPVLVSVPEAEAAGAGKGLAALDPERYGSLHHPGDGYAFDIFTQVARAIREGGEALGGATPEVLIAAGESQSAFALVTYINGVQPLTGAFDGFFVHSRGASGLPLAAPGQPASLVDSIGRQPTILRTDTSVPIINVQSESDVTGVLSGVQARQDDHDLFRLWEVAGTAHADRHVVGSRADSLGCGAINDGPMHLVAKAAFRALDTWVREGTAPPTADRLELTTTEPPALARDDDGIVLGGIRSPLVDVPVDVLSGEPGPSSAVVCLLSGSTTPLPPERVAELHESRDDYEQRFADGADEAIEAGWVLDDDREALMAYADPSRVEG